MNNNILVRHNKIYQQLHDKTFYFIFLSPINMNR